jgi:hypothetical protein
LSNFSKVEVRADTSSIEIGRLDNLEEQILQASVLVLNILGEMHEKDPDVEQLKHVVAFLKIV